MGHVPWCQVPVGGGVLAERGEEDAVLEGGASDCQRRENLGRVIRSRGSTGRDLRGREVGDLNPSVLSKLQTPLTGTYTRSSFIRNPSFMSCLAVFFVDCVMGRHDCEEIGSIGNMLVWQRNGVLILVGCVELCMWEEPMMSLLRTAHEITKMDRYLKLPSITP